MSPRIPALLRLTFWWLLAVLAVSSGAVCEVPIPRIESHVVDRVGLLPPQNAAALERRLAAFEKEKGIQLIVVAIPTTEDEPIEQFGIRLAESRPAGRKGIDDGAFLIIASADRRMRIEVGYGLEGALNDATCKRIISEIITPHFGSGDYATGVERGIEAMMAVVSGEELPEPRSGADDEDAAIGILGFLAFVLVFLAEALAALLGRLVAALLVSAGAFLIGLFFTSALTSAIIAAAFFVFVVFNTAAWASHGRGGRYYGGGSYYGGRSHGGRGGGFRLGGGGFGGGGASGSW